MKKLLLILSFAALAAVVAAPVLFFSEKISLDANKVILNTATAVWFATALFRMERTGRATG